MKVKKLHTQKQLKLRAKIWTAIGSIIIFLSWITQNYIKDKFHSEVLRIERNKLGISLNEVNKNLYQIFLNEEESRIKADSNYMDNRILAYSAYDSYANMLEYLGVTLATDDADSLKINDSIFKENLDNLKKWSNEERIDLLQRFAQDLSKWEKDNGMNTVWTYQDKLATIRSNEDLAGKIYLVLYCIGALCLGYAFIIDYRLLKQIDSHTA